MSNYRIIPTLLLSQGRIVKSRSFKGHRYIGSPINTVSIFNDLKADELFILDINASKRNTKPDLKLLASIARRSFMPIAYGGGIKSVEDARLVLGLGFEKVVVNFHAMTNPLLIRDITNIFGNQSVVASIDYVKKGKLDQVTTLSNTLTLPITPVEKAKEYEQQGAGEILLTCISNEGRWSGYDYETIQQVSEAVSIPVICHGGAAKFDDLNIAVSKYGASAAAAGSLFMYHSPSSGVLINYIESKHRQNIQE